MITDDGQRSEVTGLLEEVLRSMVDGDELHPAVERVYTALCEAEARDAAAEQRGV